MQQCFAVVHPESNPHWHTLIGKSSLALATPMTRPSAYDAFGGSQRVLTFVLAFAAAALLALLVWSYAPAKTVLMFTNKECEGAGMEAYLAFCVAANGSRAHRFPCPDASSRSPSRVTVDRRPPFVGFSQHGRGSSAHRWQMTRRRSRRGLSAHTATGLALCKTVRRSTKPHSGCPQHRRRRSSADEPCCGKRCFGRSCIAISP